MVRGSALRMSAAVLALAAVVAEPVLAEPLTLAQAQYLALKRSPELGQAQSRVGAAEALKDQAKREWLPKVTADAAAGWRHLRNDTRVNLGLSAVNEKPLYATIGVDQAVWDFGRRNNEIKSQKARLAAAIFGATAEAESVAFSVTQAYLQAMVQERIHAAAEGNLAFHDALTLDVTEGVRRGAMSVSEKQQAQERLQSAKVALAQGRNDLLAARAQLALLVGSDDFELQLPADPAQSVPASLTEALALVKTNDPRLGEMEQRLKSAQYSAKRARSERWPTVGLRGTVRTGEDFEGYRGESREYQVLLSMRWPIFDGGVTAAKIRQADFAEDEIRFAMAEVQRDSELQVRRAWTNLETWRAKLTEQQQRQAVAALVLESYRAQFGIGRRSLLDLLDGQNALYGATVDAEVARFGTLLAEYALLAQMNRLRGHFGIGETHVDPGLYGPR